MKKIRTTMTVIMLSVGMVILPTKQADASIVEIIRQAVIKVIKAADLAIQRQQNKVIWLQNAQKVLENTLSKLRLDEISEWTEKQKEQYQKYFDELNKVKSLISYYQRIKDIAQTQTKLVNEYGRVWRLIKSDNKFTSKEIAYMGRVYTGILDETVKNMEQLSIVVNSFRTQMTDAKRLEIINEVSEKVDENYRDLRLFNNENGLLRLQRSKSENETEMIKRLYGIE